MGLLVLPRKRDNASDSLWCCLADDLKGRSRMPPAPLVDPSTIDTSCILIDRDGIHRYNPQRFEMEQLTAIVLIDQKHKLIIGYKDVAADEFWVRGPTIR